MSIAPRHAELVSREGYERLRAEIDRLLTQPGPSIEPEVEIEDDLDGEVDGHALRQRRLADLRAMLAHAQVVDPPAGDVAGIGRVVRIRVGDGGKPIERRLVGPLEAWLFDDGLSIESPIGEALDGRRPGEVVEVETPGGRRAVELLAVDPT